MKTTRNLAGAVTLGLLLSGGWTATSHATVIFSENFEEATLGGAYTPPSTYGTGISPSPAGASWGVFLGDHGAIVNGTPIGTGKALAAYDQVKDKNLRVLAGVNTDVTGGPVTSGKLQLSYDLVATGTMAKPGPMQLQLKTDTYQTFVQMLIYADAESAATGTDIVFNNSTTSTGPDFGIVTNVSNGTAIRIFMDVNIDTSKYDVTLTRLSDSVVLKSLTSLDFPTVDLKTSGFKYLDQYFGFADFTSPGGSGSGGASIIVDNILIAAVPEPQTALLLGLTGVLLLLSRGRRTRMLCAEAMHRVPKL